MTAKQNPQQRPQAAGSKTQQVLDSLRTVLDPVAGKDIVTLGYVQALSIQGSSVNFTLTLPEEAQPAAGGLRLQSEQQLQGLKWVDGVQIELATAAPPPAAPQHAHRHAAAPQASPGLPDVQHVIAVGSGKGGVGKSTVAVNLALALAADGARVGILDADVYGPSIPLMLGVSGHPLISASEKLLPLLKHGVKVMSMGLLLQADQAVVWRGPMVHSVINQFLGDVEWGELDYLIVDLPPGTGDAPLSIAQALPLTAAVVVTTPQEVAASVAQKAISMFARMGLRILGVIENMSYFVCPHCGGESEIFDRGGGRALAANASVPFLGEIPIDTRMRHGGDTGEPVMVQYPDSELAEQFRGVARRLAHQVAADGSLSLGAD